MLKRTLIWTLVIAPLISVTMISLTVYVLYQQTYQGPEVVFTVNQGDTFGAVNSRLASEKIIHNTRLFHWLARYQGVVGKLRAGPFVIPTGAKMSQVLDILVYGKPLLNAVTIPEGRNFYEIAAIFEAAGFGPKQSFITLCKDQAFVSSLGITGTTVEGYLYPETYKFAPGTSQREIIQSMVKLFKTRAGELINQHPFLKPHEVVTLASIVEKETGAKIERPQIASVFTNRLKKKMRLESDPTTIYGMWESYKGNIRKDDLLRYSPYNTYKIPALPVGPISNPSLEAIQAVLRPAESPYIFFVSKNDGTHAFSTTYAEHQQAVEEWQRKRSNRAGKSWRQLKQ